MLTVSTCYEELISLPVGKKMGLKGTYSTSPAARRGANRAIKAEFDIHPNPTSLGVSHTFRLLDQLHHRQQDLSVLGQVPPQLFAAPLTHDVIWFLHDGSPFLRFSQPDSMRTGSENRRSTSNGNQDTLVKFVPQA